MITAIVGINWGDEGKGRMVDLLSEKYDIVSRYQGGNNAGHTVVNEKGKFILNLLPSGILRETTVNLMGTGMVIDIEHLCGELQRLRETGSPEQKRFRREPGPHAARSRSAIRRRRPAHGPSSRRKGRPGSPARRL